MFESKEKCGVCVVLSGKAIGVTSAADRVPSITRKLFWVSIPVATPIDLSSAATSGF